MKNIVKLFSILFLVSGVLFVACKDSKDDPNDPKNWADPSSPHYRAPVTGVTLSVKDTIFLEVGATSTLTATVEPVNAYDKSVTWESSEIDFATVDNNGKVTAVKVGSSKITVRTNEGNRTADCRVVVIPKMENDFDVEAVARLQYGSNVFTAALDYSKDTSYKTAFENGSYFSYNYNGANVSLNLYVKNNTGKIIPAGTPYKFNLKRNGTIMQASLYTNVPIQTSGVLTKDVGIDELYLLYQEETFYVQKNTEKEGQNNFCLEVLQLGKEPKSSAKTECCTYNLIISK